MDPTGADAELAIRRSRVRMRTLLILSSLSEAYPNQLARACGISASRLYAIMHGRLPGYRPELGLVTLRLAQEILTPNGRIYAITARGRRKARSLTSTKRSRTGLERALR